jgi:hypothetical protein
MQMQVRDGLAHNIVDKDHRPVGLQAGLNRALKALRFHEELLHPVLRQLAHQANMDLRNEQDMTMEQWSMIQERHKTVILVNERHLLLAPQYGTEATLRAASAPPGDGPGIATAEQAGLATP